MYFWTHLTNFIEVFLLIKRIFRGSCSNMTLSKNTSRVEALLKINFQIKVIFFKNSSTKGKCKNKNKSKNNSHAKQTLNYLFEAF